MEQRTIRPRIADVAREAGVSKTAVSFAFNSPDRLAPETAERIRRWPSELGYSPNPVARMLSQRQTLTIGVLTPQALSVIFSNPFFGAFSEGRGGRRRGVRLRAPLHLAAARQPGPGDEPGDGRRRRRDRPERRPSGGRADPAGRGADRAGRLDRPARPRLDRGRRRRRGAGGGRAPHRARPSRRPGHRRRAAGARDPGWSRAGSWRGGCAAIARRSRRSAPGSPTIGCSSGRPASTAGRAVLARAWAAGIRPTAILAMSDAMAIGAMRALRDVGLSVPGDVSVVGFDDIDLAPARGPAADDGPSADPAQGRRGRRLLLSIVRGRDGAKPEHRRLETRLIVRGSTGPVRRS